MTSVPDLRTDILLRSEQSGGHLSMVEIVVPARSAGPPLHAHDFDEAFYMLEGERLRAAGLSFRNDIVTGPGGRQILLDDPAGNPIELFQPAGA